MLVGGGFTNLQTQTASLVKAFKERLKARYGVHILGFKKFHLVRFENPRTANNLGRGLDKQRPNKYSKPHYENPTQPETPQKHSTANARHPKHRCLVLLPWTGALPTSIQRGTGLLCFWRAVEGHQGMIGSVIEDDAND